jgi:hypothetical protein
MRKPLRSGAWLCAFGRSIVRHLFGRSARTWWVLIALSTHALITGHAQLITNTFSGQVTRLESGTDSHGNPGTDSDGPAQGGIFAGLKSGDPASLTFIYDPLEPAIWSEGENVRQYRVLGWSISGGSTILTGSGSEDQIGVYNDYEMDPGVPMDFFWVGLQSGYWANVEFQDYGHDAIVSPIIPNQFEFNRWDNQVLGFDADGYFQLPGSFLEGAEATFETPIAYFRVDSFYSSIPEPSLLSFSAAVIATVLFRKRRNREV